MSITLRIFLMMGSLITAIYFLKRIREAKVQIEDTLFWFLASFALVIVSVFPKIADVATEILGIMSTVNFIFLFIIFILILKIFSLTIKISILDNKLKQIAQKIGLDDNLDRQLKQ